jgi:hypothetical protein
MDVLFDMLLDFLESDNPLAGVVSIVLYPLYLIGLVMTSFYMSFIP